MDWPEIVAEFYRELPFYLRCSPVTAEKSARQIARYMRWHGGDFPECFNRQDILRYLSWLSTTPPEGRDKARREASSVNDILKGLRRFSRWCVARGYISGDPEKNPTKDIHGLSARDRVILAPEVPAVRRFLNVAMRHGESREMTARNFAMGCALVDIGMRAAELLAMDVQDVSHRGVMKDTVVLRGKGNKERLAPISPEVQTALQMYLDVRRAAPGERALWIDTTGQRLTYPALRNTVKRICRKADVKINLHDFRRYTHTRLWLGGIDQIDGMMLSGHTNERDYRLYIRAAMQTRAVKKRAFSPLVEVMALEDEIWELAQNRKRSPLAEALAGD